MQSILNERKKMNDVEVQPLFGLFMITYDGHLEFYKRDLNSNKKWNLWKKMFTVSKDQIKTAKLTNNARYLPA
jgi:hypothetical protein